MSMATRDELEAAFGDAIRRRDSKDYQGAASLLEKLCAENPAMPAFLGTLGDIYLEQGRVAEAVEAFRRATELSPRSELASISLFHSLVRQGMGSLALQEMRRYLKLAPNSPEYRLLIDEMAEGGSSPEDLIKLQSTN